MAVLSCMWPMGHRLHTPARCWESLAVYSQQENLDLGLQLQGAEFLSINPNEQEMDSSLQPPAKNTACQNIDFSLVRPWQTSDLQNYVTRNLCYFKPQKGIIMQNICLKVNKEKINNSIERCMKDLKCFFYIKENQKGQYT